MVFSPNILICDDDSIFHLNVKLAFKGEYQFFSSFNGDEGLSLFKKKTFALVLLDIQMRTPTEGLAYIRRFKEIDPGISIIITSGVKEFGVLRDALKLGADDYILKGVENEELTHAIRRAVEKRNLVRCNERHNAEVLRLQHGHLLVGESTQIELLRNQIRRIRESFANVLITGETGTGKEVVARLLRKSNPNIPSEGRESVLEPFVAIDSATIQSSMAESILFGYERGAFTSAVRSQKGIFEEADGGVVYFDEIANMPLDIQCKLLRVLEEKEIKRLGSQRLIALEFRVVCATNQNLEDLVEKGKFKEDLLHRLNVIPLSLAPLRDRKSDIPLLINYFLKKNNKASRNLVFDDKVLEVLNDYDWPGNVRELSNLVSYLLSMAENDHIVSSDLPKKIHAEHRDLPLVSKLSSTPNNFYKEVFEFEKKILENALIHSQGKVSRASSLLGIDRSHLYNKLKEHGLFKGRHSS